MGQKNHRGDVLNEIEFNAKRFCLLESISFCLLFDPYTILSGFLDFHKIFQSEFS